MQHTNTMGAREMFSHSKLECEFTELQLLLTGPWCKHHSDAQRVGDYSIEKAALHKGTLMGYHLHEELPHFTSILAGCSFA